ncbi:methionine biosynthesis protein MetW [Desulfolutivibrio sulfoxidireducens]|uniref:methionine biosynthesis protein MetW n=1 Tax=Desulfolutivibrio sulfoxidireducens TaxID=2773299 RepID=UPI00159D3D6D|nr:methionine biosynthesis protein MetW [Desulfolutivibrio sulfoxidireducens]QLA15338.1 methionine biosynthesis protein MetW [Desulfolutivibrio sulfoxidireducens]QLA18917.1 methionine biosynthesis protein MetW [Desulfolutivibrio sulfoxidireducens]
MRYDLRIIASWITPGSRVLDLGCGAGDLLSHLIREKGITGTGIEIDESRVAEAITKGLSVVHGDINVEVADYPDAAFDYVILSQTLQQVYDPGRLIREMLRVGGRGIVSFPNFAHFGVRAQLFFKGRAPVSRELPYQWHDTPNIRVIAIKDFRRFCKTGGFSILRETAIHTPHHQETGRVTTFFPNLLATYGIFLLGRTPPRP